MKSAVALSLAACSALIAAVALGAGGAGAASRSPGALVPLPTPTQPAMTRIRDLAFDAGGRHLYAVGEGTRRGQPVVHASLARDPRSGALRGLHTGTCSTTRGLSGRSCRTPAEIEIAADGRNGYVIGDYYGSAAVTMLSRSSNGVLAPTRDGAVRALGRHVRSLALSPDGRNVYVAVDRSVVKLDRARNGRLQRAKGYRGCHANRKGCPVARGVVNAGGVALSADGRSLYVASERGVAVFRRNARSGALRQLPGPAGCIARDDGDGCTSGRGVGGSDGPATMNGKITGRRIVVSPDGTRVYAASNAGVAVFARSAADGSLRQLPGPAGCVSATAADGCAPARALRGVGAIALSPDGGTLYATTAGSRSVAVLRRAPATGWLVQPAGADGCVNATGADGCLALASLTRPSAITVSPDGRHVYIGSYDGALLAFSAVAGAMRVSVISGS
jgi:DNA-binding beta-propeller fold protein YncE